MKKNRHIEEYGSAWQWIRAWGPALRECMQSIGCKRRPNFCISLYVNQGCTDMGTIDFIYTSAIRPLSHFCIFSASCYLLILLKQQQ